MAEVAGHREESVKGRVMATIEDFKNASNLEFCDISSETSRTYEFANGGSVTIKNPLLLHAGKSGSARIFDAQGVSHYIPAGFCHLHWTVRDGKPNFVL
jgi:hypothetical protein